MRYNSLKIRFTIHFATINTNSFFPFLLNHSGFTIHFATINTPAGLGDEARDAEFTIDFATINTVTHFAQCL